MDITIRPPLPHEISKLHHIWQSSFDDDAESIGAFFGTFFTPCMSLTAAFNGTPAAAGYLLDAGMFVNGGIKMRCAMIYAVATLPEYRGRGCAAALTCALISRARDLGFPAVFLCPSEDGLFEFYGRRSGLRDWFYVCEGHVKNDMLPKTASRLKRVTEPEYQKLRVKFLKNVPHIEMNARMLSYQNILCQKFGGGLFAVDIPREGISCAVVERRRDGGVDVKELLTPTGTEFLVLSSIAEAFPSDEYSLRTPYGICEYSGNSKARRFGMLSLPPEEFAHTAPARNAWLGLAFD